MGTLNSEKERERERERKEGRTREGKGEERIDEKRRDSFTPT